MSQNGHATIDEDLGPKPAPTQPIPPQEVFRAKHAQPLGPAAELSQSFAVAASLDRLTVRQSEQIDRLDDAINKMLAAVMHQPNPPRAAIGSASPPRPDLDTAQIAEDVARIHDVSKLKKTQLENGDVSYSLPKDNVRSVVAEAIGYDREAFRECGIRSASPHLEVVGLSDRQIAAAMAFAKQRWNGDGVIIHAEGEHRDRIITHAVRANLNVDTSRDPAMAALVTKERERQANPLTRDRTEHERLNVPLLERVPAAQSRAR